MKKIITWCAVGCVCTHITVTIVRTLQVFSTILYGWRWRPSSPSAVGSCVVSFSLVSFRPGMELCLRQESSGVSVSVSVSVRFWWVCGCVWRVLECWSVAVMGCLAVHSSWRVHVWREERQEDLAEVITTPVHTAGFHYLFLPAWLTEVRPHPRAHWHTGAYTGENTHKYT